MRKISANDDVMTTREAGAKLGVAVRTVQLWVEAGLLPAWRTAGGHRRISRSAVEALVLERTFELTPVAAPPKAADPTLKILLVEDDPAMLRLTAQVIATWKMPIVLRTATNGFEGLVRIGEVQPDIVITDLHMPGMDGFQMLQALKKPGSGYASLSVIVVSALSPQEIAEQGGLPPDVLFFAKPVHFGKLKARVQACLAERVNSEIFEA